MPPSIWRISIPSMEKIEKVEEEEEKGMALEGHLATVWAVMSTIRPVVKDIITRTNPMMKAPLAINGNNSTSGNRRKKKETIAKNTMTLVRGRFGILKNNHGTVKIWSGGEGVERVIVSAPIILAVLQAIAFSTKRMHA